MKQLKIYTILVLILVVSLIASCDNSEEPKGDALPKITISSNEPGDVYLDGQYTGYKTPAKLKVEKGEHVISVATEESCQYFRQELSVCKGVGSM